MRVLIVGDSQAAGPMGAQLQHLFEGIGAQVDRMGNVGWTANEWISDGWNDVLNIVNGTPPPDYIFYILGTNDIYKSDRTQPSAVTLRDVGPMETWFIGAPSYADPALTARVNLTKPIFQSVFGNRYIDSRLYTAPNCAGRTPDCIHFISSSGLGQSWANNVFAEWQRREAGGLPGKVDWTGVGIATGVVVGVAGLAMIVRAWASR
jgi:hypothetical protein